MKSRQKQSSASLPAFVFGILALLLSAVMINHGLTDSILPAAAGLTVDESFNIDQGIYLSQALGQHGPLILTPETGIAVFRNYLPDHPPLVRLQIGLAHDLFGWLIPAIVTISGHPCNDASRGGVIAGIFNVKGTLYTLALAVNSILVVNAGISETSELPLWGDRKCIVLCQHETRKGK